MYTPHTATVFNYTEGQVRATVLEGVFLEESTGTGASITGARSESEARLFIPFGVKAEDAFTGEKREYLPAKEYRARKDRDGFWTLEAEGQKTETECWFTKGACAESCGYGALRNKRDGVYRAAAAAVRDFGGAELRHWEVRGV